MCKTCSLFLVYICCLHTSVLHVISHCIKFTLLYDCVQRICLLGYTFWQESWKHIQYTKDKSKTDNLF